MDTQNVLVVEDDAALSDLVSGLLTQAGYRPVTIVDHALIGAAVDQWQPRCVILDGEVTSTGESRTWEDAAAIRRAHPTLPVVMFTADGAALAEAGAGRSRRSQAAAFAGIVGKPFIVEEFLAT
jgi:CheY-like chemotaxis protein